jgi:hypothetical protein
MVFESMIVFISVSSAWVQVFFIQFLIATSRFLIRVSFGSLINFLVAIAIWLILNLAFLFSLFLYLSNRF